MARPMGTLIDRIRTRLIPAILTALGVMLLAAGLVNLGQSVDAGAAATASPVPSAAGGPTAPPSSGPSGVPTASPASPTPTATGVPTDRVATRVVMPGLGIDLPVVKPPGGPDAYPLCNVAMYIQELSQPGLPGATYIYAHAREGMFLPLLEASKVNDGAAMVGMLVEVYTNDDRLFLYEITEVRRHVPYDFDVLSIPDDIEILWLQTSEGPNKYYPKLAVIAKPLSSGPADPVQAHPVPKPVVCG